MARMDKALTRSEYNAKRASMAFGGDFWNNEQLLWDRVFADSNVIFAQRQNLTTGLWAYVKAQYASGEVRDITVYS